MSGRYEEHGIKRQKIGVFYVIAMVYCLCAAGAYGIEDMIPSAGPGLSLLMLLIIPIFWSLPQVLCSAELGSAMPEEGGFYYWAQKGLGEFWGFQIGWWRVLNVYLCHASALVLSVGYIASVVPMTGVQQYILKALLIVAFTLFNLRGIKEIGALSTILSALVVIAFAAVAMVGFMNWEINPVQPFIPEGQSVIESLGAGIAIGMWMYSGFASVTTISGEIENPKTMGRGIMIALPIVILTYMIPTIASLSAVGPWYEWGTEGISYGDVLGLVSPAFKIGFVFIAVIASLSIYNAYISTGSRVFFVMAADNMAPKILTKCNKHGVPVLPVIIMGALDLVLCQLSFVAIILIDVTLCLLVYGVIFITTLVMRKTHPKMERPIKIPGGDKVAYIVVFAGLFIIFVALFINGVDYYVGGAVAVLLGPIAYYLLRRKFGGLTKLEPAKYKENKKTHMPFGDFKNFSILYTVMALMGVVGCVWFPWYEDVDYYVDVYGSEAIYNLIMMLLYATTAIFIIGAIITKVLDVRERRKDGTTE